MAEYLSRIFKMDIEWHRQNIPPICWKVDQKERPTFSQIAEIIENYIESFVGMDYFNTNFFIWKSR